MPDTYAEFAAALDALAWQVELGVDEAICEEPVNRFEAPKPEPVAKEQPVAQSFAKPPKVDEIAVARETGRAVAQACLDLDALQAAIASFDGCELKKGARNTVFSDGLRGAHVMIIGEAPGREEDSQGKPFVGRSGQLLDRMVAAIGLTRMAENPEEAVYITNVIPWRPPQNRDPSADETAMMRPFLMRHIELAQPKAILLMGNAATRTVLETAAGITRMRGKWADVSGIPALPMLHPAALLRNPMSKKDAWADLLALRAKLDGK